MRLIIVIAGFLFLPFVASAQYGSDITTGITPTCDSQYSGAYACSYSNDDNTGTMWNSGSGAFPHYATFDFTTTKTIGKVELDTSNAPHCSKDFDFQVSSGAGYTTVYSSTTPNSAGTHAFTFTPTSTAYRYARINWTSNWSACGTEANITEIHMYELLAGGGSSTAVFTTDEDVLQGVVDNSLWAILSGVLLSIVILGVRGSRVKNAI